MAARHAAERAVVSLGLAARSGKLAQTHRQVRGSDMEQPSTLRAGGRETFQTTQQSLHTPAARKSGRWASPHGDGYDDDYGSSGGIWNHVELQRIEVGDTS